MLELKSTPAMRDRAREFAKTPNMDDYDRAVLAVLDDFDAVSGELERERAQRAIANSSWYKAARAAIETGDTHALQCWCDAADGKL
jgi:hypothetical protein